MSDVRGTSVMFRRQLRATVRKPVWLAVGLAQPVLYLVLFGPLLGAFAGQLGMNPYTLLVPGLLVLQAVVGSLFVGFGLLTDMRDGVLDAQRVTPVSRWALLGGRTLYDVVDSAVQGLILVVLGFAFGMRADAAGVIVGFVLVLLLTAAFCAAGYGLALTLKNEQSFGVLVNSISLPVLLLSGILIPMSVAPAWLQVISAVLPTTHIVNGVRAAFAGDITSTAVLVGLLWTI
ncbi:MAG TPA: ABC transporter permease, partial [Jiangellaceae bacterium]